MAHAEPIDNAPPSQRAMEFCGVGDKDSLLKQCRHTCSPALSLGITSASFFSRVSSSSSSEGDDRVSSASSTSSQRSTMTKAVFEWDVGRERRAMVASNPGRSAVVSAYFQQELFSLINQPAQEV